MEIIGLAGLKQSGKDTVGRLLTADHGYTRYAFADPIKEMLEILNPVVRGTTSVKMILDKHEGDWDAALDDRIHGAELDYLLVTFRENVLGDYFPAEDFANDTIRDMIYTLDPLVGGTVDLNSVLASEGGWDGAKVHRHHRSEVRSLQQRLGTEVMRETYGQQVWVDLLAHRATAPKVVVTDVREAQEAQWILERGGQVFQVVRDNQQVDRNSSHSSENLLPPHLVSAIVQNNGVDLDAFYEAANNIIFGAR